MIIISTFNGTFQFLGKTRILSEKSGFLVVDGLSVVNKSSSSSSGGGDDSGCRLP